MSEGRSESTEDRRQRILTILDDRGQADMDELRELLGVDAVVLHQDLEHLARQNLLSVQGERARRLDRLPADVGFQQRLLENRTAKERIGRKAAGLIEDGETIFLASGSTVYQVAAHLMGKRLTVVTNSLPVMSLLASDPEIELISIGGVLRRSEMSFIGNFTEESLERLQIGKVFLGIYALSLQEGLTHNFIPETITDRAILEAGEKLIIVADHSKIGREAVTFVAPLSKIDVVVTDEETSRGDLAELQAQGINVVIA